MSKVLDANAAPSPANPTPSSETPTLTLSEKLQKATPQQHKEWEESGKEPEIVSPEKETPAATPPLKEGEAPKADPEPGPETKKTEEPKSDDTRRLSRRDRKIGELSAENRRLARELEAAKAPPSSKPPAEQQPQKTDGKPVRPKLADYSIDDGAKYEADLEAYDTQLAEWNRTQWKKETDAEKEQRERDEIEQERTEELGKLQKSWSQRAEPAKKEHADFQQIFDEVAPWLDHFQPLLGDAISRHPLGPQLLMHLVKDPAKPLERLVDLPASLALAEFGEIAASYKATLARAPKPKTHTDAPEPVHGVGGRATVTEGPKIGSPEWEKQENEKDLARRGWRG